MKHFRKIINLCLAHRWIMENPFVFYKNTAKPKEKEFLTQDELDRIASKQFDIHRLAHVRDIFVFCCYTGLSYADVKKLHKTDIAKGVDDRLWILTDREKTKTSSNIPLLPEALGIMMQDFSASEGILGGSSAFFLREKQRSKKRCKTVRTVFKFGHL